MQGQPGDKDSPCPSGSPESQTGELIWSHDSRVGAEARKGRLSQRGQRLRRHWNAVASEARAGTMRIGPGQWQRGSLGCLGLVLLTVDHTVHL